MFSTLTKRLFINVVTISVLFGHAVYGCSIDILPLRKQFRHARQIFVGEVVSIKEHAPSEAEKKQLPEDIQSWPVSSKVSFNIKKSWKGNLESNKEYLSVAYMDCGCPDAVIDQFIPGKSYLVFNFHKDFVYICAAEKADSQNSKNQIKKLDSFGFRLWSCIYPF